MIFFAKLESNQEVTIYLKIFLIWVMLFAVVLTMFNVSCQIALRGICIACL